MRRLEAGQGLGAAVFLVRDRVADAGIGDLLDLSRDKADLARPQHAHILHFGPEHADPVDIVMRVGGHHADRLVAAQRAVDDPHQHDDAEIGIIPAIDQQGFQRRVLVAFGGWQAGDDGFQHQVDIQPGLGRNRHGIGRVEPDHILDLLLDPVRLGGGQVDFVEHWHNLVPGIQRVVDIGESLRLDALRSIDHQQRALAGGQRARHLIGEIDVAGRVHQVEDIILAIQRAIFQPHRLRLDGDAALALDIHRVEHLLHHVARRNRAGLLDQPVRQRRFAVIDMGNNGKIADVVEVMCRHATGDSRGRRLREGAATRLARKLARLQHELRLIPLQWPYLLQLAAWAGWRCASLCKSSVGASGPSRGMSSRMPEPAGSAGPFADGVPTKYRPGTADSKFRISAGDPPAKRTLSRRSLHRKAGRGRSTR